MPSERMYESFVIRRGTSINELISLKKQAVEYFRTRILNRGKTIIANSYDESIIARSATHTQYSFSFEVKEEIVFNPKDVVKERDFFNGGND